MYLILDEQINLIIIRFLFSYKAKSISICLQKINNIETVFTFFQKSIEKNIQNFD